MNDDHYSGDFGQKVGRNFQGMADTVGLYDLDQNLKTVAITEGTLMGGFTGTLAAMSALEYLPYAFTAATQAGPRLSQKAAEFAAKYPKAFETAQEAFDFLLGYGVKGPMPLSRGGYAGAGVSELHDFVEDNF